jgi:hypothetical protein
LPPGSLPSGQRLASVGLENANDYIELDLFLAACSNRATCFIPVGHHSTKLSLLLRNTVRSIRGGRRQTSKVPPTLAYTFDRVCFHPCGFSNWWR